MSGHFIVCDLDGTLCNNRHREHLAREGKWDEFHSLLMADECYNDVRLVINALQATGSYVLGLTGRNEKWRALTVQWLAKNDIAFDALRMRPDNDFTPDKVLKPRMLEEFFEGGDDAKKQVAFILEDRDRVVEEWRNRGFHCWQVRVGGY